MEAANSFEKFPPIYKSTRPHTLEDLTLHTEVCSRVGRQCVTRQCLPTREETARSRRLCWTAFTPKNSSNALIKCKQECREILLWYPPVTPLVLVNVSTNTYKPPEVAKGHNNNPFHILTPPLIQHV